MFMNGLGFYLLRWYVEAKTQLLPYNPFIQRSNRITSWLYLASVPLAWVSVYLSFIIFIGIPIWYFLPDKFHASKSS